MDLWDLGVVTRSVDFVAGFVRGICRWRIASRSLRIQFAGLGSEGTDAGNGVALPDCFYFDSIVSFHLFDWAILGTSLAAYYLSHLFHVVAYRS